MNHEIYRGKKLLETLIWEGEPYDYQNEEHNERREALTAQAVKRSFELKGLAFERQSPEWLVSDQVEFECREFDEDHVAVTTPIGMFRLKARKPTQVGPVASLRIGLEVTASGDTASQDQLSLPVSIRGRLNNPNHGSKRWTFQISQFRYEDGTLSGFIGCFPRVIEWETEPDWPEE